MGVLTSASEGVEPTIREPLAVPLAVQHDAGERRQAHAAVY